MTTPVGLLVMDVPAGVWCAIRQAAGVVTIVGHGQPRSGIHSRIGHTAIDEMESTRAAGDRGDYVLAVPAQVLSEPLKEGDQLTHASLLRRGIRLRIMPRLRGLADVREVRTEMRDHAETSACLALELRIPGFRGFTGEVG